MIVGYCLQLVASVSVCCVIYISRYQNLGTLVTVKGVVIFRVQIIMELDS